MIKNLPGLYDKKDKHTENHIGVLIGEGVGPELVPEALSLLEILQKDSKYSFAISYGGEIGYPAKEAHGNSLSHEVIEFSKNCFAKGGALFCGPGGGRFVYELRREFDIFCKYTPIQPLYENRESGVIRPDILRDVDIVAIRENSEGLYQGCWGRETRSDGVEEASQTFKYSTHAIERILRVGFDLARKRRGILHITLKPGGVPAISDLWRQVANQLAGEYGIDYFELEIDNAVYQLIADPKQFDVIVSPNMFGDVLADCGSLLLGSRGLSYSGNFGQYGQAVFQTAHGAARDIAGQNKANPIAQMLSLGMMLREHFDWPKADELIRSAIKETLRMGYVTADIIRPNTQALGTHEFSEKVRFYLSKIIQRNSRD